MSVETRIPFSVAANAQQFLLGLAVEEAAANNSKDKAYKKIETEIKRVYSDLRDSYDRLVPNVLVLNIDNFTNLIINKIISNPEKFLDEFSSVKVYKEWGNTSSKEYIALRTRISRLVKVYHASLLSKQRTSNPIAALNEEARNIFNRTRNIQNDVSARVLGISFGKSIRQVFGNSAVLAAVAPELGSSDSTYIFFSSSFTAIGDSIRQKVYTQLIAYIRNRMLDGEIETRSDIKIGEIVNLGHATLVSELGTYVNSPAFAKSLFTVAKGGSSKFGPTELPQAADFFKKESRIIENKIEVNKDFGSITSGYGILLALGVTFTNIEDAAINSDRGRRYEGPTARVIGSIKPSVQTAKTLQNLANRLYLSIYKLNPLLGRSGKTALEYLADALKSTILGQPIKQVKYKSSKTKQTTKTYYTPKKGVYKEKNRSKVTPNIIGLNSVPTSSATISLIDLQNLINRQLQDVISANMGDGNSRNVLNYRTGRLASSAKVEYMSESRAGMITAFYSYMKNPYATFSDGGKQSSPRSRDPKLLISKSIREIAAQQVGNRLRAVNI
jgi:hypothetical protein